jgi:hypothetical protein
MDPAERRALLGDLARLPTDADLAENEDARFLPLPLHSLALDDSVLVVSGERGAGKTALFRWLKRQAKDPGCLKAIFPDARITDADWVEGFSEGDTTHPSAMALETLAEGRNEDIRLVWLVHLVGVMSKAFGLELPGALDRWSAHRQSPRDWRRGAEDAPGELLQWLDDFDARRSAQGRPVLVTYDHLDRIGLWDPALRTRYSGTLLALWQSLTTRYRAIRPKIFLREDLLEAGLRAFPDASKLKARAVSLRWEPASLYRVLVRQMSCLSEPLRAWIELEPNGIKLTLDEHLGWLPPDPFPEEGPRSYSRFVEHLAGTLMGAGIKKGFTYRWILNHLQDAHVRVVPRSMLNLGGGTTQ